mmetsp:Transcript_19950/g.23129  ORF Transcript_19950/g.23129 Transcript_19950/m.23129 type:complete len:300 (-) Transcript_19950:46-945(-)
MKIVIAALILSVAFATIHPVNHEIVEMIKHTATTWTPMEPEENPFAYMSIEQIKGMMGTKRNPVHQTADLTSVMPNEDSFDAREKWTGLIHEIRNQGSCGGCWAFGATEALSDRLAIASNGAINVILSPQYLLSCDESNFGCQGGDLHSAWMFLEYFGAVTEQCYPYTSSGGFSGYCKKSCSDGSEFKFYNAQSIVETADIATIKTAVMTNGPVEASFDVYSDFMSYKEGIYQHTGEGDVIGGHAVKIVGWGKQDNTEFWILANSWGTKWGEQGFFRMKMGDCGINDEIVFATAEVPSY